MPLYDYRCQACGEVDEHWAGIDDMQMVCPHCGGEQIRRITTRYAVHGDFKPRWVENIADKPVWIDSNQAHRAAMKQHQVYEKFGKGWL